MRTLILIADSLVKSMGTLFIQVLALYVVLGLGMIVTVAYAIRKIWQARTPRPVFVTGRAIGLSTGLDFRHGTHLDWQDRDPARNTTLPVTGSEPNEPQPGGCKQ